MTKKNIVISNFELLFETQKAHVTRHIHYSISRVKLGREKTSASLIKSKLKIINPFGGCRVRSRFVQGRWITVSE